MEVMEVRGTKKRNQRDNATKSLVYTRSFVGRTFMGEFAAFMAVGNN